MKRVVSTILVAVFFLFTACGDTQPGKEETPQLPSDPETKKAGQPITGVDGGSGNGGSGGGTTSGGNNSGGGLSQTDLNNILGTYSARLYKGYVSQNVAFRLSTQQLQGGTYLYIELYPAQQGPLLVNPISAYMGMFVRDGVYGRSYTFMSQILRSPTIHDLPLSIEFNYFGPTQATMNIRDCGFASNGVCLNQVSNTGFDYIAKQR